MKHVMQFMAGLLNVAFEKVKDGNGLFLRESRGTAVLFTATYKPYTSSGPDTPLAHVWQQTRSWT